jgi:phosphoribosylformimino-5-aminoimidazole carboxamide ribotide isomerase
MMQLIPAIDLLNGEVVRLRYGEFSDSTQYQVNASQLAQQYAKAGAGWLHIVDLAASRDGDATHPELLEKLLQNATQKVQIGGGVRSSEDVNSRLESGANRVVVGTICVTQTSRFLGWIDHFGADRLVSALDVKFDDQGIPWPRTHGWTEAGERNLWDLLDDLSAEGLKHLLCTDISKDGAMSGPNFELYRQISERYPQIETQASGGVSGLRDLEQLKGTGASSVITGKALLDGCFTVEEALEVLAS